MLVLSETQEVQLRRHVESSYPEEGCGFLIGHADPKAVVRVEPVANIKDETRARRYLIDPNEFVRLDQVARGEGLDIIGIYHSHPDHPAKPSDFDRDHAWPWYSYIVVAVEKGVSKTLTSWVLNETRTQFMSEEIQRE